MTDNTQSKALRLADELEDSLESHDGSSLTARCQGIADDAAAELRRLHAENASLKAERDNYRTAYNEWHDKTEWVQDTATGKELGKHRADVLRERIDVLTSENASLKAGYAAARLEIESLQARIKTMAEEHADELMVAHLDGRMRAGQPIDAMLGEQAELRRLSDCCPELNLSNYGPDDVDELNGWAIEVSQCIDRALAAQPAYKDSTPELHVGDSAFENWYSTYNPAHKADKQRARDAYAAGMGDPLVTAAPAAVAGTSEMHEAMCPALTGGRCTCERNDPAVDKAWARFCGGIGDGPDAPYPGMISAFERYYSQSFTDKDWRNEASVWAAAWKQAMLTAAAKAAPTHQADSKPAPVLDREAVIRAAVAAMPHTNPMVADDLLGGFTMHTEAADVIAIFEAGRAARAPADSVLEDAMVWPKPGPQNQTWTICPKFLEKIMRSSASEYMPGLEEIEAVLLGLRTLFSASRVDLPGWESWPPDAARAAQEGK